MTCSVVCTFHCNDKHSHCAHHELHNYTLHIKCIFLVIGTITQTLCTNNCFAVTIVMQYYVVVAFHLL